jgi:outer membrane lipoprotein-sorting protein
MHSLVTVPGRSAPLTMTGQVVFDAGDRMRGVITAPHTVSGGPMKLDIVSDGTVFYMRSSRFGSLPDGAEWMSLDLSLGDELDPTTLPDVDAKGELALLEGVDNAQKLGKEDVRGVSTTRYRGALSVADQVERMRDEDANNIASVTEKHGGPMRVEAWIDAEGLVRRMRLIHAQPAEHGKGPLTIDMTMDFFDFGFEPEIEVPDSSEVFDATDLARQQLGVAG